MGSEATATPGILCCLTSFDGETQRYISHCLNHDLIECGKTAEEAWENLKTALRSFIEYSYTNNPDGLKISADPEDWREFFAALRASGGNFKRVEEIFVDLKPPLVDTSIWIQGVFEDGPAPAHVQ